MWCRKAGILLALTCSAPWLAAQTDQIRNPYTSPADVTAGAKIFRSHCAVCHGLKGSGGRGPDLTRGEFRRGSSDAALLRTISKGIPGTEMGGIFFSDNQIWQVVTFVQSLSASGARQNLPGDIASGKKLFRDKGGCFQCHMVNGEGGRLGPDLSDVGARRSPEFIRTSIVKPSEVIHLSYRVVRIVGKDGKKFSAIRLNEDTFSIQVMDMQENLLSLLKRDLQEIQQEKTSSMLNYEHVFTTEELEHLTAYLYSLRRKATP